jgi:4,5-dihydroxyphthalate decarboxylase
VAFSVLPMTTLKLTYAGEEHFDRTAALQTGRVSPPGIDLNYVVLGVRELFRRQAQFAEFETSEMSVSTMMMMISRGIDRFVGIPAFPSRHFRHRQLYVNVDAGIERPEDLVGKRVGVPEYQMTAALWIRAFLQHDYGVAPQDIRWFYGGLNSADYAERMRHETAPGLQLEAIPANRTLSELLEAGELDAIAASQPPRHFREGSPRIRRLFADYREVEREYYERTGFFPIMHMVAVRRDVYEANRWVPVSMLQGLVESRQRAFEQMHDPDTPPVGHPWWHAEVEQLDRMFGGDPYRYGFENNRAILEAMTRYSFEQGLSARKVDPEELFAPETLGVGVQM